MIVTSACHNHTTFCDGKNTPAEMVQAAYEKGFTDFGFSAHTRTQYTMQENYGVQDECSYRTALQALRAQYAGKLNIAIGVEQDYYAPTKDGGEYDFILGSVHDFYDSSTGRYYWVDGDRETLFDCRKQLFADNGIAMVKAFYSLTAENALRYRPDIVAHFDLIIKNNGDGAFFDEQDKAYRNAALEALHACMETDAIFEVNTGGIYRGYRTMPYPDAFLLKELCQSKARVMISADAHTAQSIDFRFAETVELLRTVGFRSITVLCDGKFVEKSL